MHILIDGLRYDTSDELFVGNLKPYRHQAKTLELVREALTKSEIICVLNTSVTGSGKTLANFAPAILDGIPTLGVYPTNELIRDQERTLRDYLAEDDVVRIDSDELDHWQDVMQVHGHAQALQPIVADWEKRALLTNPDILYLMAYDLYGFSYKVGYRERIFQALLNEYPIIAFDEFHLYDTKQVGNVAFIVGTIARLAPNKHHIFIFSSATPRRVHEWAEKRLGLRVENATFDPAPTGRVVCEPLNLALVPTDLSHWRGLEAVLETVWPEVQNYLKKYPTARGVFIFDSVYDAKALAAFLSTCFGKESVGEIHGYMDKADRAGNLERRFSVGTTTIDVGVDLTGDKAKEFIVFEARSGAQFIQRLGRLGRRGRETEAIAIPNQAWGLVPNYVRNYVSQELNAWDVDLSQYQPRANVLSTIETAYTPKEEFQRYWTVYSPYEATAAKRRILSAYLSDRRAEAEVRLHRVICELYRGITRDAPAEEVTRIGQGIEMSQLELWKEFGHIVKRQVSDSKVYEDWYLDELETFRGGGEFQVALYDKLDERRGLFPFKLYNLPFVLRRTAFHELSKKKYVRLAQQKAGTRAEGLLRRIDRAKPLGYLRVEGLVNESSRFWFQMGEDKLLGQSEQLLRLEGWEIALDASYDVERINEALERQPFIAWYIQMAPWDLTHNYNLPPLFQAYPLRPVSVSGRSAIGDRFWSVAFGLNAFFLSSLDRYLRGSTDAIIL
jgi:CRISPR-associated endonuclease/helicase Cas3